MSQEYVDNIFIVKRYIIRPLLIKTQMSCHFHLWYPLSKGSVRAKSAQNEHFLSLFFVIWEQMRCLITKPFRERNNLVKYYKKHYYCFGVTPITFEKIAKNTSKKLSMLHFEPFRGGGLLQTVHGSLQFHQDSSNNLSIPQTWLT